MDAVLTLLAALAAIAWLGLLALPWRPWDTRERLEPKPGEHDLSAVTVLIPARNEADHVAETVAAVRAQGPGLRIWVIDDQSEDDTAARARAAGAEVLTGHPPPPGWSGKLWALEEARRRVRTSLILQLDADITLEPGVLPALLDLREQGYSVASAMALLPTGNPVQRLLLPAYVWFFKLLYPFSLANSHRRGHAAAAGGCLLIDRHLLDNLGGYRSIAGALIDDCALAAEVKRRGSRTWVGLSHEVISRRDCSRLGQVRDLVARTAYTQLGHSPAWLLAATTLMLVLFWAPPLAWFGGPGARIAGTLALIASMAAYTPMLRYYRLSALWVLGLPITALLYLWMCWVSAWRHWSGGGAEWKGRRYPGGMHPADSDDRPA